MNCACPDLCGGCPAMGIPTAIPEACARLDPEARARMQRASPRRLATRPSQWPEKPPKSARIPGIGSLPAGIYLWLFFC